jgi:hypothetical protein
LELKNKYSVYRTNKLPAPIAIKATAIAALHGPVAVVSPSTRIAVAAHGYENVRPGTLFREQSYAVAIIKRPATTEDIAKPRITSTRSIVSGSKQAVTNPLTFLVYHFRLGYHASKTVTNITAAKSSRPALPPEAVPVVMSRRAWGQAAFRKERRLTRAVAIS